MMKLNHLHLLCVLLLVWQERCFNTSTVTTTTAFAVTSPPLRQLNHKSLSSLNGRFWQQRRQSRSLRWQSLSSLLLSSTAVPVPVKVHGSMVTLCDVESDDTTHLCDTTANPIAIPIQSLQGYILQRNVTIRSVNWCAVSSSQSSSSSLTSSSLYNSDASTLLQIYQGASVPPIVGTTNVSTISTIKRDIEKLVVAFNESDNVMNIAEETLDSTSHNGNSATSIASLIQKRVQQYMNQTSLSLSSYNIMSLSMKISAELRATQNTIHEIRKQIHILYLDDHICVVNKPSGILSVPGPRRNPNICEALFYLLHPSIPYHETNNNIRMDQMVVHRLDMDTSGILIFALSKKALHQLHTDFRQRQVTKVYEALVCHHIVQQRPKTNYYYCGMNHEYEINVDLERDPYHIPFMRIAQKSYQSNPTIATTTISSPPPPSASSSSPTKSRSSKFLNEEPKPSLTEMHILSFEYINDTIPVTRVRLIPRTGRTHQLRVHMAQVLHHPIVGDDIYGYGGECFPYDSNDNNNDYHYYYYNDRNNKDDSMWNVQRQLAELGLPLCLHAQKLYIRHPISGAPMIFECQSHF